VDGSEHWIVLQTCVGGGKRWTVIKRTCERGGRMGDRLDDMREFTITCMVKEHTEANL